MADTDARDAELLALLAKPELYADKTAFDAAVAAYASLKSRRQALEGEWLELLEALEGMDEEPAPKSAKAPRRRHGV
jgi:hypothetical protein